VRYIPNSPDERASMLHEVGLDSAEALFNSIPAELRLREPLNIPSALSEMELLAYFEELASQNLEAVRPSFLGAGAYQHYSPTIIDHLISRSEFFTSYTPYQPEISQGTLQAIFEFQTMVCQLTGMEVANASMYDGSTALAEAVLMAERVTNRSKVLVSSAIHPEYLEVAKTYVQHAGIDLKKIDFDHKTGLTQIDAQIDKRAELDNQTAALIVQSPNFFGCIENLSSLAEKAHAVGALFIVAITEPVSLGILQPPGACGADIVIAEGQSFGIPLSYGGPYVGLFATREKFVRQMPGRLVGQAMDQQGRRGFVLTLATREQHIKREKATSNICTNEGLIALAATIYMTTMGRRGMQEVAYQSAQKTAYLIKQLEKLKGFSLPFSGPRFNEFVLRTPIKAEDLLQRLAKEKGITGGLALSHYFPESPNDLLVCVTEVNTRNQIDSFIEGLREIAS
jgi:glycine dehydrogenase subunit 1